MYSSLHLPLVSLHCLAYLLLLQLPLPCRATVITFASPARRQRISFLVTVCCYMIMGIAPSAADPVIAMAVADVLFLPWPSWAKLSFVSHEILGYSQISLIRLQVLGGLLIIVSSIAGVTKVMKWRKLLRLEKECADKEKSGETTAMVATPVILPFGVRALDKDSIEGVWNARTATTLHGPRSKNSSPLIQPLRVMRKSKRETSVSSIPSLEIGEPSSAATPGMMALLPCGEGMLTFTRAEDTASDPSRNNRSISIAAQEGKLHHYQLQRPLFPDTKCCRRPFKPSSPGLDIDTEDEATSITNRQDKFTAVCHWRG